MELLESIGGADWLKLTHNAYCISERRRTVDMIQKTFVTEFLSFSYDLDGIQYLISVESCRITYKSPRKSGIYLTLDASRTVRCSLQNIYKRFVLGNTDIKIGEKKELYSERGDPGDLHNIISTLTTLSTNPFGT